jgi:hypothetical protein
MDEEEIVRGAQVIRAVLRFTAWYLLGSASVATLTFLHFIPYRPDSGRAWAAFFLAAVPVTWLVEWAADLLKRLREARSWKSTNR